MDRPDKMSPRTRMMSRDSGRGALGSMQTVDDTDTFYGCMGKVIHLVRHAYRRANCDDWNYALLMKCSASKQMCPESICALESLIDSAAFDTSFNVKTSVDNIKEFQQRSRSVDPVDTQTFCMVCARALFELHRFFDALEFTYQALKLILVDVDCVFPRWTRPVFDKIAGNFKNLWALCKTTQISAFAENVRTVREDSADQFVEITAEMFRLTESDILKKCTESAVDSTRSGDGEQDLELDTWWPIIPMYIIWIEHFFKFKDLKKISANLPKFGTSRHRFVSNLGLGLLRITRDREPGGEIEPFHMFPFEKSLSGESRDHTEYHFQWFDMARLNYLMAKFCALMQIPILETPYNVALDIFPKAGQSQDCLQGFYGNYELFGVILNYAEPAWHVLPPRLYPKANKLLAIFLAFCRLAHPEVAERKAQEGQKPRLATAAFCRAFCPGLEPFVRCIREGNVDMFRQLQNRHSDSLWRLGLTVLVASLETLVIRRLVICYIATYLDVTGQTNSKHLHSVKQMLRSPVFSSRWSDSEDAKMQAVIMLFSSKMLKATVAPNEEDPSDLTLAFSPQRAWPAVPKGRAKKK